MVESTIILLVAFLANAFICDAQIAYSRVMPYDPRYVFRRVPVRRSAEAAPRLRMPITRYFPQVDTEVAPASYLPQETVMTGTPFRLTNGEVYALPTKWADEEVVVDDGEDNDYDGYEYDSDMNPVYATNKGYMPERVEPESDYYNNMMMSYLLGSMQQQPLPEDEYSEVQRRSDETMLPPAVPSIDKVAEENKKRNTTSGTTKAPSTTPKHTGDSSSPLVKPSPATPASQKKVEVAKTARVELNSGRRAPQGLWHDFALRQTRGQKEFPMYRSVQSSPMASLESQMSRGKSSSSNKDALPIIEKMMAAQRTQDPIKDQLDSLKFRSM